MSSSSFSIKSVVRQEFFDEWNCMERIFLSLKSHNILPQFKFKGVSFCIFVCLKHNKQEFYQNTRKK